MKSFFKYFFASLTSFIIGCVIIFFIGLGIISSLINSSQKVDVNVKPNTVLKMSFSNTILDRTINSPFINLAGESFDSQQAIGLNDILKSIKKAKTDPNIEGILLNSLVFPAGSAITEEIRSALVDFKTSGKFIYAYSDIYDNKNYYLSSVANKVYMSPEGVFQFNGLRAEIIHYKNMFDKLGIEMQVFRHGEFKSAVEPFLADKMSENNKYQIKEYVDASWESILNAVSESRSMDVDEINRIADGILYTSGVEAVKTGLIDGAIYHDELEDLIRDEMGLEGKSKIKYLSIQKYSYAPDPVNKKEYVREKIALVYANGPMIIGEGNDMIMGSDRIVKTLRKVRSDDRIKAVVLRVNSGGGMSLAGDLIWHEVKLTAKEKPVIASISDVAASGGYYMIAPSNYIIADKNSITGSIGVFATIPQAKELLTKKIGLTVDGYSTNKNAGLPSMFYPYNEEQRVLMQNGVEKTYQTFISKVASGRNMEIDAVDKVAGGRVWTAPAALEVGLIDEIGGLDRAIEIAAEKAGLSKYGIKELPYLIDPLTEILNSFGSSMKTRLIKSELGKDFDFLSDLDYFLKNKGIHMMQPYSIQIK